MTQESDMSLSNVALRTLQELPFQRFPILLNFLTGISSTETPFKMRPCQNGMEFHFHNDINGIPNRAHLRIFFPGESKCVLFFHKKSAIPFSRDRFSYGGVVIDERSKSRFTSDDIKEWVEYLLNGFNPNFKPRSLKKSLPYTVPED
jgi:hypothetical protein